MKKLTILIMVLAAVMLVSCDKRKKPAVEPEIPVVPEMPEEPVVEPVDTNPAVVEPVVEPVDTVSIIEPIDTILHDLDSVIAPVPEGWRPQYESAYGKGVVTIVYKQRQFSSPVVVHYLADSIITASVQPMFGIEMYRLEAHRDKARLFEKLNRRYVEMTYEEISAEARRTVTFDIAQQMVEEVGLTYPVGKDTTVTFSGVRATLLLQYRAVNQPISVYPLSTSAYNRTTLKALLSK